MDDRGRGDQHYGHDAIGDEVLLDPAAAEAPTPAERDGTGRSRLRTRLLLAGLIVLLGGALIVYLRGGRIETTEDAAVQAGRGAVAANVSGQVVAVLIRENDPVHAGQVLFRIDPRPFETAVADAAAKLAEARAQVGAKRADYRQGEAGIATARARLAFARSEAARQKDLFAEGISSRNQYDQALLAVQTGEQAIQTSVQQAAGVRAALSGDVATPVDRQPAVRAAQAVLDRARLDLGYADVRAAQDGVVTHVDQLQVGDYVVASRPVFTLVAQRLWVEAQYKESQLRYMRVGQPANVTIDAYPGVTLAGHVASFSPGTGTSFALLPAQNATGNWVKVVQRLPVRIDLDDVPAGLPLHAGLSAEVGVDTGHVRHLLPQAMR